MLLGKNLGCSLLLHKNELDSVLILFTCVMVYFEGLNETLI